MPWRPPLLPLLLLLLLLLPLPPPLLLLLLLSLLVIWLLPLPLPLLLLPDWPSRRPLLTSCLKTRSSGTQFDTEMTHVQQH